MGWHGENKLFSRFMHRYLENGTRYDPRYGTTNRKLHIHFRLTPRSMTLDKFKFSPKFCPTSHFWGPIQGCHALTFALARLSCCCQLLHCLSVYVISVCLCCLFAWLSKSQQLSKLCSAIFFFYRRKVFFRLYTNHRNQKTKYKHQLEII